MKKIYQYGFHDYLLNRPPNRSQHPKLCGWTTQVAIHEATRYEVREIIWNRVREPQFRNYEFEDRLPRNPVHLHIGMTNNRHYNPYRFLMHPNDWPGQ